MNNYNPKKRNIGGKMGKCNWNPELRLKEYLHWVN
jgi:hypothetical protein